ncbi:hypothetical protein [Pedobacter sp. V48]|uniref:hypothetical protein n=1 Tax=Pedobacter sp. V48 TaxID=509635 RepID=UPI0003E540E2|nr:hypothetical protein [Pedobacter sp. V48]ETZ20996.1 hypothetical protein N824_02465 [Pedobacter sp. V48]
MTNLTDGDFGSKATITENKAIRQIVEAGILPLYFNKDIEVMKFVLDVSYTSGIRVFEFMNRGGNALDLFSKLITYVKSHLPGMLLGVGTVCEAESAAKYINAGAQLIIAPNLNLQVGAVCEICNVPWIPGVFTPTELYEAKSHGAKIVKLFPANLSSPDFIKSMKGPFSDIDFIATGGITPDIESIGEWISAGASAVGIGSSLFSDKILLMKQSNDLASIIISCLAMVKVARQNIK